MSSVLSKHFGSFARDEGGSTAIVFALCVVAISLGLGLSIDMARASRIKSNAQDALDAAVIAVSAEKQAGTTSGQARLDAVFTANWQKKYESSSPITSYEEINGDTINAAAHVSVPTTFMKLAGYQAINVTVTSASRFGLGKAEVALVLDTTGSMSGSRMDALKQAATDLVEQTYQRPNADTKIKFSIVPFGQYVNIGTETRGQSWLSVPNDGPASYCSMVKPIISKSGCTTTTQYYYDDGRQVSYQVEQCTSYEYGPEQQQCSNWTTTWNGCVGSRAAPKDREVELTSANPIPGVMDVMCGTKLKRLSNSKTELKDTIQSLIPVGETYMAPGLMWGWRTLSPTKPFEEAAPKSGSQRARKVLVLMTDGTNTASSSAPTHLGWNPSDANTVTADACAAIKADGIEIYAIAFEVTDPTALGVLQACATSHVTHYFNATDATKLTSAFQKIGESLTMVRLSQ